MLVTLIHIMDVCHLPVAQWALPPSFLVYSQVASLRLQLEQLQGGSGGGGGGRVGGGVRGGCGPEAPCGRSLAAMEHAHRQALGELQRQHERQMKDLESEKDRLLLEETQDTARGQPTNVAHISTGILGQTNSIFV